LKTFINETEDHVNKRLYFSEEFSSVDSERVEIKYPQFSNIVADITVDFNETNLEKNAKTFLLKTFFKLNCQKVDF
jgi:hypothetical protein